jgi:5-methylcytosine-specific restriction protein A
MPMKPPTPCAMPGCGRHAHGRFCDEHQREHNKQRNRQANKRRPSPHKQGYTRAWNKLSRMRRRRYPMCERCHRAPSQQTDHIVPKSRGGTDDWESLEALCGSCHSRKTASEDGGYGVKIPGD